VAIHVAHVAVAHTLFIRSSASVAYVSVKWLTAVSFQVSQRLLGKNDDAIIFSGEIELVQTKKV
jgi:hypothetical protein